MTVRKRDKTWQYDFRHNDKRYRKGGFPTKREATAAENERLNKLGIGVDIENDVLFTEYFKRWVETTKANVSVQTMSNYKMTQMWVNDFFDGVKMKNITRTDYQAFLNWFGKESISKDGKKVKGHSKEAGRKVNGHIKSCVSDAIFEGILYKDFTFKAQISHIVRSKTSDMKFFSLEEIKAVRGLAMDDDHIASLGIFISLITGARHSDIKQLKYDHLNEVKNEIFLPGTKNDTAARYVKVSPEDMQIIFDKLKDHPRNMNGLVFYSRYGIISNATLNKRMRSLSDQLELPYRSFHSLRHTHASVLIYSDVSIFYISKRLGHTSPETTMRVYSHLIAEKEKTEEDKTIDLLQSL